MQVITTDYNIRTLSGNIVATTTDGTTTDGATTNGTTTTDGTATNGITTKCTAGM